LKQEIAVRQAASESLKKSQEHYQSLLAESLVLQKHLQKLVRRVLSAEETDRKKLSHELQDEIGQTLLGINVRLLTVKKAASQNAKSLRQEIARTERLVGKSVKTIKRGLRE
jgi:signal transduction histidine kinase